MQIVKLNLIPGGVLPVCFASQHDTGRVIRFMLFEGENVFTLSGAESIELRLKKPDGSELVESVTNTGADYVDVVTTADTCDMAGASVGEIAITDGGDVLGSGNFGLFVESDAFEGGGITTQTASGPIATFETNIETAFVSLKSDINPVQSGSGTPSPNNPRPISGFNGATIVRCGVNLFNPDNILKGSYDTATNNWSNISGSQVQAFNFDFKANTQYTFSGIETQSEAGKNARLVIRYTDGTSENIFADTSTTPTAFTKTSASGKSINFVYYGYGSSSTNGVSIKNFQIEYGTTAHDFKPYIGSKYAPYFEGLLNGSYGFVDLGSLNWQKNGTNRFTSINQPANIKAPSSQSEYAKIACPNYQTSNFTTVYSERTDKIVAINTNQAINIVDKSYNDATTFTNAMNGVYLIYELATPTTPTITQSQIDTLIRAFGDDLVCVVFGQEVYGGVLDVTNGKVTITHGIVDLGTLSWTPYNNTFYAQLDNAKSPSSASTVADIICSQYEADTLGHVLGKTTDGIIAINDQQSRVHIYDSSKSSMTGADFKTAMSGVQLVYELATPIEITTTPENLTALSGQNNVYSDTNGDTEVEYYIEV